MQLFKQKEPLRVLSKIIQLFSLTKNLNREQWEIVHKELWSSIARDISLLFPQQPLVQIWVIDRRNDVSNILASSTQLITFTELNSRARLADKGCIFDVDDSHFLYIELPFTTLSEEQKMLLCTIVDHLKISHEWRDSLEHGFEIQKRIDLLHKITVAIRGSLNLHDVLAITAKDLGESLKTSRCFIRRYDPNSPGKVLATEEEFVQPGLMKAADIIFDFENEWMVNLSKVAESAISQSDQIRPDPETNILYLENVEELFEPEDPYRNIVQQIELKTFLGVPLLYKGMVLGSLCFHQSSQERYFQRHELEFIRQVADEATVAIIHAQMYSHIQQQAKTDSLTGLYNKASFFESLNQEVERCKRTHTDVSVMMIDMDYLKKANDSFGHIIGDEMIKLLGSKLKQVLRQVDLIGRFGGDEFGVILPDTSLDGAKQLAHRLSEEINKTKHPICGNLSASIGVSGTPFIKADDEVLIEEADKALYLAKKKGKGMACFSDDEELQVKDSANSNPEVG
jgi:diguanylate cyclase (GGDEF)-like protein